MKVRLLKLNFGDDPAEIDLTIGKIYTAEKFTSDMIKVIDDVGDGNILYDGEWELVE